MTNRFFVYFCILSLCIIGCLTRKSEKVVEAEAPQSVQQDTPPTIAELALSLEKTVYQANEPIPIQMTIRVGKFDLLVPSTTVEGNGAFTGLIVKDGTGKDVSPKPPITMARRWKTLMRDGTAVDCIKGFDLKSGKKTVAALEDVRSHYKLAPGDYTLQAFMNLEVYREVLQNQSAQIVELQKDIALIHASRHSAEAKQEAIGRLREDIDFVRKEQGGILDQIYLPLDSRRGAADLESNVATLTVE